MLIRILCFFQKKKHQYNHGQLLQREPNGFTGRLVYILCECEYIDIDIHLIPEIWIRKIKERTLAKDYEEKTSLP